MKKYCFIVNEETKEVRIGAGVNDEYYASIGMEERDVEQAYNGAWYVVGYAPVQTAEEIAKQDAAIKKLELTEIAVNAMMSTLSGGTVEKAKTEYTAKLNTIEDSVAMYMPEVFPVWDPNSVSYTKGQRIFYNDVLYRVLTDHTSQESWTPETAPSLFVKVIDSISGEIPEWQKPSADNAYKKGDKVKFEGRIYESLIDSNVWSPTEYPAGWKDITDEQTVES